ncbi:MAG: hypothetical protein ACR2N6_04990 [Miltoncostaeaceae bacterium]
MAYGAAVAVALAIGVGLVFAATPGPAEPPEPEGLRALPWAHQPDGAPTIDEVGPEASIVFPPGVTYAEALKKLYVSVSERNALPNGVVRRSALPREVALVAPANGAAGVRLSLTAPWGWSSETRQIRPPSFALSGDLSPEEVSKLLADASASGAALPAGAVMDTPVLESCQKAVGAPDRRPACR